MALKCGRGSRPSQPKLLWRSRLQPRLSRQPAFADSYGGHEMPLPQEKANFFGSPMRVEL